MIADACIAPAQPGLVTGLLADTDCQVFGLVERGYAALAEPGSEAAATLTAMMVIAVALFGYQLMLGRGLSIATLTGLVVRLGIVVLLAASWATVQVVVYDTLARAPTRVAEALITSIDAPAPLEGVQVTLERIEQASIGWRQRAGIASPLVGGPPTTAMTLNVSAFLLTITTIGLLVISRVVLALLLALTPLIAGFVLFNATRGLLEGWLRAVIAAALVPVGVLVLTAVELAVLTPILNRILTQQAAGIFNEDSVTPLGLVTIVFSIAILASLGALRSIANGIRLAPSKAGGVGRALQAADEKAGLIARLRSAEPERAAAYSGVVRALETAQRRDSTAELPIGRSGFSTGRRQTTMTGQSGVPVLANGSGPNIEIHNPGLLALRPQLRNRASRAARLRDR